jgi:pimeloyl-ACP methyl ester carboxylesterase
LAVAIICELATAWTSRTLFLHAIFLGAAGFALAARLHGEASRSRGSLRRLRTGGVLVGALASLVVAAEVVHHVYRNERHFQSRFLRTTVVGQLARTFNVIPEADLCTFGAEIVGVLGWFPPSMVNEFREITAREYSRMAEIPDFAHAGNVAVSTYTPRNGHYFLYLPHGFDQQKRYPLIVFLHGAAGNMTLYPWMWSRFADHYDCVVICPSWDNGEWWQPGGVETVSVVLQEVRKDCALDNDRVFLAGYSNGGMGGWAVLKAMSEVFHGFLCIAGGKGPGWDDASLSSIPVLLVHGEKDEIVPIASVRALHRTFVQQGRRVETLFDSEANHLILFSKMDHLAPAISEWMTRLSD